jgi:hypothetical protein
VASTQVNTDVVHVQNAQASHGGDGGWHARKVAFTAKRTRRWEPVSQAARRQKPLPAVQAACSWSLT